PARARTAPNHGTRLAAHEGSGLYIGVGSSLFPMSIAFDRPLLLLLLPVCIGFVYALWRTSRVYMPPLRRRLSLGLRVAIVVVLLAVLAEPRVQLQANDLAVAFLLDRSDSVTPSMQADGEAWLAARRK